MKFKTNIKCDGCIATVTPALNQAVGADHWQVDLSDPRRTLTIDVPHAKASDIQAALAKVGYSAEPIDGGNQ
jgi:copper chaperone